MIIKVTPSFATSRPADAHGQEGGAVSSEEQTMKHLSKDPQPRGRPCKAPPSPGRTSDRLEGARATGWGPGHTWDPAGDTWGQEELWEHTWGPAGDTCAVTALPAPAIQGFLHHLPASAPLPWQDSSPAGKLSCRITQAIQKPQILNEGNNSEELRKGQLYHGNKHITAGFKSQGYAALLPFLLLTTQKLACISTEQQQSWKQSVLLESTNTTWICQKKKPKTKPKPN